MSTRRRTRPGPRRRHASTYTTLPPPAEALRLPDDESESDGILPPAVVAAATATGQRRREQYRRELDDAHRRHRDIAGHHAAKAQARYRALPLRCTCNTETILRPWAARSGAGWAVSSRVSPPHAYSRALNTRYRDGALATCTAAPPGHSLISLQRHFFQSRAISKRHAHQCTAKSQARRRRTHRAMAQCAAQTACP